MKETKSRTDRAAVAVFDIFTVLILLLLCSAFLVALRPRTAQTSDTEIVYTVRFPRLREEYVAEIHEGDAVLDAVGKRSIGRVVSYTVEPAYGKSYDAASKTVKSAVYPGYVTLTLAVRAFADVSGEGAPSVLGLSLLSGSKLALRLPNFAGTGVIAAYTLPNS